MIEQSTVNKIRNIVFYVMFSIELVGMLYEKSSGTIPYQSYIFRVTFMMSCLVVVLTKHDLREWLVIAAICVLGFYCYRHTGRNDLWRVMVFTIACKDIDIKKALKYAFWVTFIGSLLIAFLSISGIYGDISLTEVYRKNEDPVTRYCFGFGHPNSLQTIAFVNTVLFVYVYNEYIKKYMYAVLLLLNGVVYYFSDSRTAFAVAVLFLLACFIYKMWPQFLHSYFYTVGCVFLYLFSLAFSMWAAFTADKTWWDYNIQHQVDAFLNGRIMSIYFDSLNRRGWAGSWSLFSDSISNEFFDMGWVRLYYWYGIIPATLIVILIFTLLLKCAKDKDVMTAYVIAFVAFYTIVEAHFVSDYIGRNFVLLIIGERMFRLCKKKEEST